MDWETYSEAGYVYHAGDQKWRSILKGKNGLEAVGMAVYAQHPTTEVLCLTYHLPDCYHKHHWKPGDLPPYDLWEWHANGGEIEAHNSGFEFYIWYFVMYARYGWPLPNQKQFRCSMAKARAYSLPGGLDKIGEILKLPPELQKDKAGKALLNKVSIPRSPTKANPELRLYPHTAPELFTEFYGYNDQDVCAEMAVSDLIPDLTPDELDLWLLDQRINLRGVCIDRTALDACISIIEQATIKYQAELQAITEGQVQTVSEVQKMTKWLAEHGTHMYSMEAEDVEQALERTDLPPACRRVLEIRSVLASASVKKVFAISRQLGFDDRLRELFSYCGAPHTGRFAGRGPQPQNLYKGGPDVRRCGGETVDIYADIPCNTLYWKGLNACPMCGTAEQFSEPAEWGVDALDLALEHITTRNLEYVESMWGDPFNVVAGCLRGLFVAAPGADLIASDFSAIEAVVLAVLAGEQWRVDVFRTHGKIYETTLAMITGIPFQEILDFKKRTGKHHPLRTQLGKVPELACFGSDTSVLTDSGWKRIANISTNDKLFDGCEFVAHGGVISRGIREVIIFGGMAVTPDHKFYIGNDEWATAADLKSDVGPLHRALVACPAIAEAPFNSLNESKELIYFFPTGHSHTQVFDVINCGPLNRFTVLTDYGPLIAHNSGFQGSVGAWKQFGADEYMNDEEILANVRKWRAASPMIVKFWYSIEDAARMAIQNPGQAFQYRGIVYEVANDILHCLLPSGRILYYWNPELIPDTLPSGRQVLKITYMGMNSDYKKGPKDWIQLDTYGGKLTENIVQAVARDILAYSMKNVDAAGYAIVMHVHDEIVSEILQGTGSIEEFERIMSTLPPWAADWPLKVGGGWRGRRYRKD